MLLYIFPVGIISICALNKVHASTTTKPPYIPRRSQAVAQTPETIWMNLDQSGIEELEIEKQQTTRRVRRVWPEMPILWEFIIDELTGPEKDYIKWKSKPELIFQIFNTTQFAQAWRKRKGTERGASYEHTSRMLRRYREDGILLGTPGKLTFKIAPTILAYLPAEIYRQVVTQTQTTTNVPITTGTPTSNPDANELVSEKAVSKTPFLWQFIIDELTCPSDKGNTLWTDRIQLTFRIRNTERFAQAWHEKRGGKGAIGASEHFIQSLRDYIEHGKFLITSRVPYTLQIAPTDEILSYLDKAEKRKKRPTELFASGLGQASSGDDEGSSTDAKVVCSDTEEPGLDECKPTAIESQKQAVTLAGARPIRRIIKTLAAEGADPVKDNDEQKSNAETRSEVIRQTNTAGSSGRMETGESNPSESTQFDTRAPRSFVPVQHPVTQQVEQISATPQLQGTRFVHPGTKQQSTNYVKIISTNYANLISPTQYVLSRGTPSVHVPGDYGVRLQRQSATTARSVPLVVLNPPRKQSSRTPISGGTRTVSAATANPVTELRRTTAEIDTMCGGVPTRGLEDASQWEEVPSGDPEAVVGTSVAQGDSMQAEPLAKRPRTEGQTRPKSPDRNA